jgi:Ribbon-helix-helix protein, copG family
VRGLDNGARGSYDLRMNVKIRNIQVDADTADRLEARAAARGMSLSELLAEMAGNEKDRFGKVAEGSPASEGPWSPEVLAEDARRLAEFEDTRMGAPWSEIKAWMETWGTPAELSPPVPRKL